jgi:carbamoyl-phosphate synthase large subunit
MQLRIPCLTSMDTANALAEIIESRFNLFNTELVDINHLRPWKQQVHFAKMQSCGNDYIFVENFDGRISAPESICVRLCRPHFGIGGDGVVLIEPSTVADARMRIFNQDGSEGRMSIETRSGIHRLYLYIREGRVSSVSVDMGIAEFDARKIPVKAETSQVMGEILEVDGRQWKIYCVSMGNPHCVVFCDDLDSLNLERIGPLFEHHPRFPDRVNVEFVRVVNPQTLRIRVFERGNGETLACGTGACAAAAVACELGLCSRNTDIRAKMLGGDLRVCDDHHRMTLTGEAVTVFEGSFEY